MAFTNLRMLHRIWVAYSAHRERRGSETSRLLAAPEPCGCLRQCIMPISTRECEMICFAGCSLTLIGHRYDI